MKSSRRFAIIDPGLEIPETDSFNFVVKRSGASCTYHLPALAGPASLAGENLGELAGIIILGSAASVNRSYPWQDALKDWLRAAIFREIPVFGICYGHQLLAQMYGGEVAFARPSREMNKGLRTIHIGAGTIFPSGAREVVVTHNEAVSRVPEEMRIIATSSDIAVEGLQHRSLPVFSFQCHPEATADFLVNNELTHLVPGDRVASGQKLVETFLAYAMSRASLD